MLTAFVKVNRSEMKHNKGELFYSVCYEGADGRLWGVLDPMEYPYAWGFFDIKHALRIADNYNDPYSEISCSELAKQLADKERPAA